MCLSNLLINITDVGMIMTYKFRGLVLSKEFSSFS